MTQHEKVMWELAHERIQKIQQGLESLEAHAKLFEELDDYFRYEEFDEYDD